MSKKTKPNTIKLLRNEPYELSDIVRADIIERMNSNMVKVLCDNMVRVNGMMSKVQSNIQQVEDLKSRIGETFPIEEVRETQSRFQKVYKELMDLAIEIDCAVLKDLKPSSTNACNSLFSFSRNSTLLSVTSISSSKAFNFFNIPVNSCWDSINIFIRIIY